MKLTYGWALGCFLLCGVLDVLITGRPLTFERCLWWDLWAIFYTPIARSWVNSRE